MKRVAEDVKRELARFGSAAGLAELVEAWPEAVGETIARNAWPARVARDGTVHVNTLDSVWAFELTSRAPEIASRLRVEVVKFAPGPLPEPPVADASDVPTRRFEAPPAVREQGERLASAIEDENLRKIVARAAAASLARDLSDRSV